MTRRAFIQTGLLACLAAATPLLTSCETFEFFKEKPKPQVMPGGLVLPIPLEEMGKWVPISGAESQYYAQAKEGMADTVILFAARHELATPAGSTGDLKTLLQSLDAKRFAGLTPAVIGGVQVLRHQDLQEDKSGGLPEVQEALGLRPRPSTLRYVIRTRAIILLHPKSPAHYVVVGCSRTSDHGAIGSYYERVSEQFFHDFILQNCTDLPDAPPPGR